MLVVSRLPTQDFGFVFDFSAQLHSDFDTICKLITSTGELRVIVPRLLNLWCSVAVLSLQYFNTGQNPLNVGFN